MKVRYGVATFSRWRGVVSSDWKLPVDGTSDGGLIEFLESAGESGWELCGTFPSGVVGHNVAQPGGSTHKTTDAFEEITFMFKKV